MKLSQIVTAGIVTIAVAVGTGYGVHQHDQTNINKQKAIISKQDATITSLTQGAEQLKAQIVTLQQTATTPIADPAPPPPPPSPTARCMDGTYSYSAHHQGTCSYHGGVAVWYR